MTAIRVLTPSGSGAIAVVEIDGANAWDTVTQLFKPSNGKPLPKQPTLYRTWFSKLGEGIGDEVIIAVKRVEPTPLIEIHCHGGIRVVRWVVEKFTNLGCEEQVTEPDNSPWSLLEHAPTLHTANILLDQVHGAFERAVENKNFARLAALASIGRHLIEPWKVVIAGPPNVGKSSLVNALAGYQRSIVSPIAGTTRDVVTTRVAFDGWPVELSDTAGLRESEEELEAEGIERAKRSLRDADLVVWVYDGESELPVHPDCRVELLVINKTDAISGWDWSGIPDAIRVSAMIGNGITELIDSIVLKLVPVFPHPGEGVPYTIELADQMELAARKMQNDMLEVSRWLPPHP